MSPLDEAIIANDALPERERKTNIDLAEEFNTSEATVRRHRRALKRKSRDELSRDEFFDLPVGAITKRGKTVRLADGSYEKIEYRPGTLEMEEAKRLSYEDLEPVFQEPLLPQVSANAENGTLIVCMADYQVGKVGQGGSTADTVRLVRRAIKDIADNILFRGHYKRIILADVGDSTEGFWNVASQAQTNDLSLTDQIRVVQRLYAEAVRLLAPLCESLYYVAVPSNLGVKLPARGVPAPGLEGEDGRLRGVPADVRPPVAPPVRRRAGDDPPGVPDLANAEVMPMPVH